MGGGGEPEPRRPRILSQYIYELKRGLRHLILFTSDEEHRRAIVEKLRQDSIPFLIQRVAPQSRRINVFFGSQTCIDVIRAFGASYLVELTPEQDFILGVMLGYDRLKQCERYLSMRRREARSGGRGGAGFCPEAGGRRDRRTPPAAARLDPARRGPSRGGT